MAVYFKCKNCGEEHLSPISFSDRQTFEFSTLSNNTFQCPKTRLTASYDKKDMVWKDGK